MAKFYALQIKRGKITLDDVPAKWHDAVAELIGAQEETGGESNGDSRS